MFRNRAWRTPFSGADPALNAALDAADLADLVKAGDQWDAAQAALPPEDFWQDLTFRRLGGPLALGAIALGVLLLLPAPSGRRR